MMITKTKPRFWRIEWVHRSGYQAPHYYVETKKRPTPDEEARAKKLGIKITSEKVEAIQLGKEKSRLADFPKLWSIKITKLFHDKDEEE